MGSKKKAAKKGAAAPLVHDGPKSPEALALEAKVSEQGEAIRALKGKPKTAELEAEIKAAVEVLKQLKADLNVALSQS